MHHTERIIAGHDYGKSAGVMSRELDILERELRRAGLEVRRTEPMSMHTSYQIGGPADLFAIARDQQQLLIAARQAWMHGIAPFVLGTGANLLVADAGIRGLVIAYRGARYEFREVAGETLLWAQAGAAIKQVARESVSRGLEGLEWAVGVPGTVGGAIVGNAGAYGGYVGDIVRSVEILEPDGVVHEVPREAIGFRYRSSDFKEQPRDKRTIILSATLVLRSGDTAEIATRAAQYAQRRSERQPTECSCGSVFKRTENYPPGFLIEQCGLKGERRGNAMISLKHANFVVNLGDARAVDVRALIELMREQVREQFGENLELEVELVGEW